MNQVSNPAQADTLVTLHGGRPVTNTLVIADKFGKQHKDILKAVSAIMADCPEEFSQRNFAPATYPDAQGKPRPMYELTEKAFALVAMGFTGQRFTVWKIAFLEEFERRGRELSGHMLPRPGQVEALRREREVLDPITPTELEAIMARPVVISAQEYLALSRKKPKLPKLFTNSEKATMSKLLKEGASNRTIAKQLGRNESSIRTWRIQQKNKGGAA